MTISSSSSGFLSRAIMALFCPISAFRNLPNRAVRGRCVTGVGRPSVGGRPAHTHMAREPWVCSQVRVSPSQLVRLRVEDESPFCISLVRS